MSFGGRSLRGRNRRRDTAAVELTPLIDITFQLLIFFLLTATFQDNSSLDVELARAKNQQKAKKQEAVVVGIGSDGRFEIGSAVVDLRELEMRLCVEAKEGKRSVHIRADRESTHERLVEAMDLAKACGFENLGILHQN